MASRSEAVAVQLRELILRGELAAGSRLSENALASRLEVSRTPIRQALRLLAGEGLVAEAGGRGYEVRTFSVHEMRDAITLRGVLEGLAALMVAEAGASRGLLRSLSDCLAEGDLIFDKRHLELEDEWRYGEMNQRFHGLIIEAAGSAVIEAALGANNRIPFAGAGAVAFGRTSLDRMFETLWHAHRQHHAIVRAIEGGEGARVEWLFREHSYATQESLAILKDACDGQGIDLQSSGSRVSGPLER